MGGLGVAVGAGIHGWLPAELLADVAGVVPVAEALWVKGMATGTVLAFMMSTVALSVPELVLLRQVLKPRLLGLFFGSVASGIVVIGFAVNLLA